MSRLHATLSGTLLFIAAQACAGAPGQRSQQSPQAPAPARPPAPPASSASAAVSALPLAQPRPVEAQLEPDGNDEGVEAAVSLPPRGHFEKVGRHWAALQRVCDFAVLGDSLYMAHATQPLGLDGATVTRYRPSEKQTFSLAFNWNREGEPQRGGGGGQGFLRLRKLDQRLFVPDADPPYLGLGLLTGIEGYLFVSDGAGVFAGARLPGHLPARLPTETKPGAAPLPGVLHGFDVIRFRGKLYASSSAAIPPNGNAKTSPGTLLTPQQGLAGWQPAFSYAGAPGEESVRLGYMTRFRDRLYVSISPLYDRDRHDFLIIAPPRAATTFTNDDVKAVQITKSGGAHTLRWYADRGRLYWITIGHDGVELRVSEDGEQFRSLPLPIEAGNPADVLRVGENLLVLAEHGLYELQSDRFELRAPITDVKSPFAVDDGYCAPPLVAFQGNLYAGDQRQGALWKLTAD